MSEEEQLPVKVEFKSKSRRNIRKRKDSDDSVEETNEDNLLSKLEEMKDRQKLRSKPNGINILSLAIGKKISTEEGVANKDPFNVKSGGMVNMQALKTGKIKTVEDPYDTGIGTQFSAETNKRDEDEEMMKYIEDQLSKKKGIAKESSGEVDPDIPSKYLSPEEAALLSLPSHLSHTSSQRSEEMLSNQMLSGIPEVDLGIEAKIRNIEATEDAKLKFLQEQQNKKDLPSHFVPSNMAVNFIQHNRFKIDQPVPQKRRHPQESGREDKAPKKATDDYHFDKFKKQYRRH
ncbi:splicing factor C9orf78 [Toxorhynchites rutilus septentrionalis]|uniref:splicing factor C9orf78 n=1 Tax=Toxorhynchites rutilus septentrionalis TaxID=329112 RepID=UPI00247B045F|nr:splicing factor C9orf78 [Toxorhynchites rutilus septentrionalis]